jgi:hypothetical protein
MFRLESFDRRSFKPISWAPADESQVPEDELREEYHGHGKRRSRRGKLHRQAEYRAQFQDATDADIRALVDAKWDAIAKSSPPAEPVLDKALYKPADKPATTTVAAVEQAADHFRDATKMVAPDAAKQEAQRQANDEALVLALLELA